LRRDQRPTGREVIAFIENSCAFPMAPAPGSRLILAPWQCREVFGSSVAA
jgi:hypothetical protein